jgi:hypothetical protein
MKKILCMLFALIMALTLNGCAQAINTETEVVDVVIIEADYDPPRLINGVSYPEDYAILLRHENFDCWIHVSRDTYLKYKDLVGTFIEAKLVVVYYDDGTIEQRIELIEEPPIIDSVL